MKSNTQRYRLRPALLPRLERLESRIAPAAFVVTNTADSGSGTLRQAILSLNSSAGGTIDFNILGLGTHTIALSSPLPAITTSIIIDGTSQVGYNGRPLVEVNGAAAGANADGFDINGVSATLEGLIIDGFSGRGVSLTNSIDTVVRACYIGVGPSGIVASPNGQDGVFLTNSSSNTIGGPNPADGNLISGNQGDGIHILFGGTSNNNLIENNAIGTDASGTEPLGNGGDGINLFATSANNQILNNLISGNSGNGIAYFSSGETNNLIQGNLIGTDRDGIGPIGNGGAGIDVGGPPGTRIIGNVISGNNGDGVDLVFDTTLNTVIQGNLIGVAKDGVHALGNLGKGVSTSFNAASALVGGPNLGDGNVIAYNGYTFKSGGVEVDSGSTGIAIEGNAIYSNYGLGIDLGGDGVTQNSPGGPQTGANLLQNFPVLSTAGASSSATAIGGSLNSAPNTAYRLDFFASPGADPTGYGEGKVVLGVLSVTTDASGNASFNAVLLVPVPVGWYVSATATDPAGNTSEFSADLPVPPLSIGLSVSLTANTNSVLIGDPISYIATVTNVGTDTATGVVLSVALPAGVTYQSATASQGNPLISGAMVTDAVGALAGSASATLVVNAQAASLGALNVAANAACDMGVNGSTALTTHVIAGNAAIAVAPTASPHYGQGTTFTTTLTAAGVNHTPPTGTVTFLVDGTQLGTSVTLINGVATSAVASGLIVGTHTISVSYSGDATFPPKSSASASFLVAKAHLTVTADSKSRGAGLANPPWTYSITGFINGDNSSAVVGAPSLSTTATTSSALGSYPISVAVGTLTSANYDFPNLVSGVLTVTPKENPAVALTSSLANAVYGQTLTLQAMVSPAFMGQTKPSGTVSFFVDGVSIGTSATLNNGVATSAPVTRLNAGTHTVSVSYAGDAFFNGAATAPVTFAVAKAHLTVTANNQSRPSGMANPSLTDTITGFVNGDTTTVVSGAPALSTGATISSPVGSYVIAVGLGTLSASNYDFPFLVNGTLTVRLRTALDFDGVGHAEIAYVAPRNGQWYELGTSGGNSLGIFGAANLVDIPVPGDYDGLGHTELAVFRPSTAQWFVLGPTGGRLLGTFGATGLFDIPVPGDYDGVGHTEMAVFRPSTGQWIVDGPHGSYVFATFGAANLFDIPVPGDYDGIGHTEAAVFRPSTAQWFVLGPSGSHVIATFGATGLVDVPAPGDYDGTGHTEPAVFRPATGQWFVLGPTGTRLIGKSGIDVPSDVPAGSPTGELINLGILKRPGLVATAYRPAAIATRTISLMATSVPALIAPFGAPSPRAAKLMQSALRAQRPVHVPQPVRRGWWSHWDALTPAT
jgi:uncharacterized repeat protein (TIGR01451 family)